MEISPADELYAKPIHPYTSALLGAIPIPDPKENRRRERPIISGAGGHLAVCHHPQHVSAQEIAAATRSPASPESAGEQQPDFMPEPSG